MPLVYTKYSCVRIKKDHLGPMVDLDLMKKKISTERNKGGNEESNEDEGQKDAKKHLEEAVEKEVGAETEEEVKETLEIPEPKKSRRVASKP